ncbi:hypothetical protein, partial [Nocardia africana]
TALALVASSYFAGMICPSFPRKKVSTKPGAIQSLFAWLGADDYKPIRGEVFETMFLNHAVGHHTEIAGRPDWYSTVVAQARDVFARRNRLAAGTQHPS